MNKGNNEKMKVGTKNEKMTQMSHCIQQENNQYHICFSTIYFGQLRIYVH